MVAKRAIIESVVHSGGAIAVVAVPYGFIWFIWAVAGDETAASAANPVKPAAIFVKWVIVLLQI
jgi:hypothetical protein